MIRYAIDVSDTRAHTFSVELTLPRPATRQIVSLPVWIPGSYLVREFARHLCGIVAEQAGRAVVLEQLDKASWSARCEGSADLIVRYRVYAFDLSVRAAFLDAGRGFFNGTSLCLRVDGRAHEPHGLSLRSLPLGWDVATALQPAGPGAPAYSFVAADYDALVDHPFELGRFWHGRFEAGGVVHEFVVAGALPDFDGDRLLADATRICERTIGFWHGPGGRPPFERYVFLLNALDDGRGGLEHRSSTALVAPRRDLPARPAPGEVQPSDAYVGVLGLIAHEYFHAWNVKRLKPRDFTAYDYGRENYTELLWFFEGFTSYYDDLLVARSGLIDAPRYLKLIAKTIGAVAATPGRTVQSAAASSFDAWVKYYRGDENTPNATVSYYAKGALIALAFDLSLRSEGRGTLDDVMRSLWTGSSGGPIDETDIGAALEAVGGRSYATELAAWVHGTDELPLEALLREVGIETETQPATLAQRLGIRVNESALTGVKVTHVLRGGAGEGLGLCAGDELIAAGDWRLRRLDDALRSLVPGSRLLLLVGRDQRLHRLTLEADALPAATGGKLLLRRAEHASAESKALCEAWIAG